MSASDFLARLSIVEEFIKRREDFFKNLMEEKRLKAYFLNSNLAIIVFSAVYGATMGVYPGIGWTPAFFVGSIIFMLVGTQLAWVLRPYFHYYPQFVRPFEKNFYVAMIELVIRLLRGMY